jgi:RHS repeat-associated protein
VGNITHLVDASFTKTAKVIDYTYDDLNRLTQASTTPDIASGAPNAGRNMAERWTYDALGNILTDATSTLNGTFATTTYTYSATGDANPDAATQVGSTTLTYDNDGNQLTGYNVTKTWDWRNHLGTSQIGATTTYYSYDENDKRTRIDNSSVITHYPNDLYQLPGDTLIPTKHVFVNGHTIADIIGATGSGVINYDFLDHLGSTEVTADSNNRVQEVTDYTSYGVLNNHDQLGGFTEGRKYVGQLLDTDTNLNYLQARYFSSTQGQFISQDPSFLAVGDANQLKQVTGQDQQAFLADPQQMGSYSYGRDNPIVNTDPTGRAFGVDDAAGIVGGSFVGGTIYVGSSLLTQQPMTWGGFAGSVVSGGIVGWGTANAPETGGLSFGAALALRTSASAAFGGAGALFGNLGKQLIDTQTGAQSGGINGRELTASAAFGFVTGGVTEGVLPSARIPILSEGRGNWNSTGVGLQTKMSEGLINRMSLKTATKSAVGSQASNSYKTLSGGIVDIARTLMSSPQPQNETRP